MIKITIIHFNVDEKSEFPLLICFVFYIRPT